MFHALNIHASNSIFSRMDVNSFRNNPTRKCSGTCASCGDQPLTMAASQPSYNNLLSCNHYLLYSLGRVVGAEASLDNRKNMSSKCYYFQVAQSFCESYIPNNTLQAVRTQFVQNPLIYTPGDGLDITMREAQLLNWTPTTKGTVSLTIYRAPTDGDLVKLHEVVRTSTSTLKGMRSRNQLICALFPASIRNNGTYTWTPFHTINNRDIVGPDSNDDVRAGRVFTIAIVPDSDPSKVNYWPAFAIKDDRLDNKDVDNTSAIISTADRPKPSASSTSLPLPDISALPTISGVAALPHTILTDSTPLATTVVDAPKLDTQTTTPTLAGATFISAPAQKSAATSAPGPTSTPEPTSAPDVPPGVIVAIVLGAITIVLLSIFVAILACRRRRRKENQMQRIHELPVNEKSRGRASSRAGVRMSPGVGQVGWSRERDHHREPVRERERERERERGDRERHWERERERERERDRARKRGRVELESGWGPPEIDSKRLHGKSAYVSPRVSVPPKSRVVSEYL